MTIEDIITALEKEVKKINDKASFVIQRNTELCKHKAFKDYRYTLWYIDNSRKKQFSIIVILSRNRATTEEEDKANIKEIEMKFMETLFNYIRGEKFKLILGGSYDNNEQVSNSDN